MIINGHWLPNDPFENYRSAAWDRHGRPYVAQRHTPIVRRWLPTRYGKAEHATVIWTNWLGRIWIARTR